MTSLTTILALFPLTLGFSESADLQAPMAIAVISGLTTSTLLTLVVIPCVYYVFDRGKKSEMK
jgi:HAE1 family hydrophobic/amphiphilic exporter-1